jgi:hypothetical protein
MTRRGMTKQEAANYCGCESLAAFDRWRRLGIVPDGGGPTLENCKLRCKTCADIKTETEDKPQMAKADRVLKKTYGLRKRRRTIPGRKFDGTPIPPRWVEE